MLKRNSNHHNLLRLLDGAPEVLQGFLHVSPLDLFKGLVPQHRALCILGARLGAHPHGGQVFLAAVEEALQHFGALGDAQDQHASGKRVQGAAMTHLDGGHNALHLVV